MDLNREEFKYFLSRMYKFCSYRDRCESEVTQKLREIECPSHYMEELILLLTEHKFLNEERYLRSFVSGKFRLQKWGKQKIKYHLRSKGFSDSKIDTALKSYIIEPEYFSTFRKLALQKLLQIKEKDPLKKKKKLVSFLTQKGVESGVIWPIINEIEDWE